jgi:Entner-Doudoroff aldolase
MSADEFVSFLEEHRASAILRTSIEAAAAPAMEAAIRAGFRIVEFTLTTPGALDRIREFSTRDGIVVGAGTVLHVEQVGLAVEAGARFIVSPVVDEAVIGAALASGVAAMPGAHTPTEMIRAHGAGAQLQKLFPAPGTGPAFVRACLGPLPFLRIVPTNDVDASNAAAYLRAGAFAVGLGNKLFLTDELREGRFDQVEQRARQVLAAVHDA